MTNPPERRAPTAPSSRPSRRPAHGPPHPPHATYRLQVTPTFTLFDAAATVPYLARLGVSHVYTSPLLASAPGSQHGYDVIDHSRVDDELGGEAGLEALRTALEAHAMGLVLDIVPNHMAVNDRRNRWWWDVLEHGPESRYADYFDIDWDPDAPTLTDRVLVPVLARRYADELADGSISVERDDDRFVVRYGDLVYPVRPSSYRAARAALGASPERVHELLELQHYRLAQWRTASEELGYRRFFDVTSLAGLRIEDLEVFEEVHALALRWVRSGLVSGLRVDHPDGLRSPRAYLQRLAEHAPGTWIVIEKILERGEELRTAWPVAGTTGYDIAALVTGLLVDRDGERRYTERYARFTGDDAPFEEIVAAGKDEVVATTFGAEVDRLTAAVVGLAHRCLELRDLPRSVLRTAIAELLIAVPVYRTYVEPPEYRPTAVDLDLLETAHRAALASGRCEPDALAAVVGLLDGTIVTPGSAAFVARFQQTSGSVMAKGVEDTAFYRYSRLLALNEVGADPGRFGVAPEEFHAELTQRAEQWPATMVTSTTHDTKRSEDVRARLAVLSEVPDEWFDAVTAWHDLAPRVDGLDADFEHYVFQTLVGAWPISPERLEVHLAKAMREAKRSTSWTAPDPDFERAVQDFARQVLADDALSGSIASFVDRIDRAGRTNGLAMKLMTLTVPGVPDLYQGSELWTDSLVDPDNRRPVDFEQRAALLDEVTTMKLPDVLDRWDEGVAKLFVVARTLAVRSAHAEQFVGAPDAEGYAPLEVGGAAAEHAIAYRRGHEIVVVVPRCTIGLEASGGWQDTTVTLPPGSWTDAFTDVGFEGGEVDLAAVLARFPVALLVGTTR